MVQIEAGSISLVTEALFPERAALTAMLRDFGAADWAKPTECPAYSVQGIATHILGDDLSLLSRQRDGDEVCVLVAGPSELVSNSRSASVSAPSEVSFSVSSLDLGR
jgi:hypothetical protein